MLTQPNRPFTFIDLFAGIGGFRFALEPLGGDCVFTAEWDRFARETYAVWHDEDPDDLTRFAKDITKVAVTDVPEHDVLAAGFPCQPFSLAGVSKKNALGREHGFADPTQGTLFFNIKEIAAHHQPPVLLLENVKNLLSHDRGETWRIIREELDAVGYEVFVEVIDARHWVPQHRERAFIVWLNRDVFPFAADRDFVFPPAPQADPTLLDILEAGPVPAKYTLSDKLFSYLVAYREKHRRKGNGFGFSEFGPDDVARTLSARYHKDGSEILISQPETHHGRPRRLTPWEAQRLMGFDAESLGLRGDAADRLEIVVSDTQAYRQFGNAVVPAVVNHVAAGVFSYLDSKATDRDWTTSKLDREALVA
jgi:DNA (cytosine-5)-methyltransferase 1